MDGPYEEIDLGGGYSQRIYSIYNAWYLNGKRHREHGPAIEYASGSKEWWLNGERHREDGPAFEDANGYKAWYINGEYHREDGPAVEYSNFGFKSWWLNGERHREDGPAVEYADGTKVWCLNGINVTAETIGFIIKRKRKLALNYWLLWTDYVMNPTTERGRRYANRQYDKLEHI